MGLLKMVTIMRATMLGNLKPIMLVTWLLEGMEKTILVTRTFSCIAAGLHLSLGQEAPLVITNLPGMSTKALVTTKRQIVIFEQEYFKSHVTG